MSENKTFPMADWKCEVANGDTKLGYKELSLKQGGSHALARAMP